MFRTKLAKLSIQSVDPPAALPSPSGQPSFEFEVRSCCSCNNEADNRGGPTAKQNVSGQSFLAEASLLFSGRRITEREMSEVNSNYIRNMYEHKICFFLVKDGERVQNMI